MADILEAERGPRMAALQARLVTQQLPALVGRLHMLLCADELAAQEVFCRVPRSLVAL